MEKSNIYKAIADFQQEVPVILKDTEGYGYKYADLPKIFEAINPLMKKHGLGFYQSVNSRQVVGDISIPPHIETVVFHVKSGETISSQTEVPVKSLKYQEVTKRDKQGNEYKQNVILGFEGMNMAQAYGSLITYFRRYALSSILGLVTDKDTDGTSKTSGNKKIDDLEL